MTPTCTIHVGDCLDHLRAMPDESVHCVVTSPPYYGLRDYGVAGQIGLESTPAEFLARLVAVFEEVRRVLRKDGTCWVNMGDSYAANRPYQVSDTKHPSHSYGLSGRATVPVGLKPKDLMGMPWRLAIALQDAGWWLRQDIIWHKPNPMPESTKDRCTKAHEYIFLLTKSARYFWDAAAVREPVSGTANPRGAGVNPKARHPSGWAAGPGDHSAAGHNQGPRSKQNASFSAAISGGLVDDRNKRSVWTIPTSPCKEAHFATFPPDLVKPCILAGCPQGGTVLDQFFGSGTTGMVALELGRSAIGIELNPEYAAIARRRCNVTPGLALT